MQILYMLLIGLIIGALAKAVMPGRDPGGILVTIALGIAGSVLAGFVGREMHVYAPNEAAGFIVSILGAVVLLVGYRQIMRMRSRPE
jgi:uncharacterized membrane protein YeaQ/YmgE (transglycosylase-associated protein family)